MANKLNFVKNAAKGRGIILIPIGILVLALFGAFILGGALLAYQAIKNYLFGLIAGIPVIVTLALVFGGKNKGKGAVKKLFKN